MVVTRRVGDKPINLRVVEDAGESSSPFDAEAPQLGPDAVRRLKGILKDRKNPRPSLQQIIAAIDQALDVFDPANKLPESYRKLYLEKRKEITKDLIYRAQKKQAVKRAKSTDR